MGPASSRAHRLWPAAAVAALLAACGGSPALPSSTTVPPTTIASPASPPAVAADLDARLQGALDDFVRSSTTAGVSAAVLWPEGAFWEGAAGWADEEAGRALTAGDTMRIASITKAFTATVLMQLVEEGRLGLDDPVAPLLPGLGLDETLTLRHLLGHRSGLWNYTIDAGAGLASDTRDPRDIVALAVDHGQVFPPGSHFAYSNTNYLVAGLVIEAVTGNRAEEELRSRVLEPAGCAASFMVGSEPGEVSAVPYGDAGSGYGRQDYDVFAWTAGGLAATPEDLVRFLAALFGGSLVQPAGLEEMTTAGDTYGEGAEYGLGLELLDIGGSPAWGHRGGIPGYLSAVFHFPEAGVTIAVTSNDWRGGDLMGLVGELAGLAL